MIRIAEFGGSSKLLRRGCSKKLKLLLRVDPDRRSFIVSSAAESTQPDNKITDFAAGKYH